MSNKTIFKRIALVAVSALGAGLLSVAPASAALSDVDENTFAYSAGTSVGICKAPTETTSATAGDDYLSSTENAAQSGEVLVGGVVGFTITEADTLAATGDQITVSVSGPGQIASHTPSATVGTDDAIRSFGSGMKSMTLVGNAAGGATRIKPGTAMTVSATAVGTLQVTISRNAADGASPLTIERYTFVVSTSCVTGSASVANSFVRVVAYGTADTSLASNATETEDATLTGGYPTNYASSADRIKNGGTAYIAMRIKDGTSAAGDVTTQGIFSASATNGAIVGFSDAQLALESSSATAAGPSSGTAQTETVLVAQGTANEDKPVVTTVSVYFNGVLYGTRTITFTGKPTAITILPAYSSIAKAGGVTSKYALAYEITDSAGNKLTSDGPGVDGSAAFSSNDGENNPIVASSGVVVDPTQAIVTSISTPNAESTGFAGTANVTCGTGSGTAKVYLKYTFSNLTSITSANYDMACAYGIANYKASLDKASYQPGEIATLTITATDKNGKPVYDVDATPDNEDLGSSASPVSISLPQMTAVTAATNTDEFVGGKKTYKFTVGSTEGTFTGVVDLPLYNGTTYAQTAQTVTYKVASGTTGVTNAEVLAAIVKLIASINKQIRALQKSLRR